MATGFRDGSGADAIPVVPRRTRDAARLSLRGVSGATGVPPVYLGMTGKMKLSQNSPLMVHRATIFPHPIPLPKGEGIRTAAPHAALSLWEGVGVRAEDN